MPKLATTTAKKPEPRVLFIPENPVVPVHTGWQSAVFALSQLDPPEATAVPVKSSFSATILVHGLAGLNGFIVAPFVVRAADRYRTMIVSTLGDDVAQPLPPIEPPQVLKITWAGKAAQPVRLN